MTFGEAVKRLATALLPWPARRERKAAIDAARTSAQHARAGAEDAARQLDAIKRIAYDDNHFSQAIISLAEQGWGQRKRHKGGQ